MKRILFLTCLVGRQVTFAALMLLSFGVAQGAEEIKLDRVIYVLSYDTTIEIGLTPDTCITPLTFTPITGDTVIMGTEVTWDFRLTNTDGDRIDASTNGFQVWTHSGGAYTDNFSAITYDKYPWGWFWIYLGTGGLVFNDYGVDGVGADTIGFGGTRGVGGTGIVDGTDSLCWWVATTPSADGDTLCIDSAFYPPGGEWLWSTTGGLVNPDWGGPYCFHVHDTTTQVNNPPVLAPIGPQSTTENVQLTFDVSASDVESIPTLTTSTLPGGANFTDNDDGTGNFTWVPNFDQANVYYVTFIASDGELADSEVVEITVNNTNRPPEIDPVADTIIDECDILDLAFSATDPDGDSISLGIVETLPDNMTFTDHGDSTAELTFAPDFDQAGTYPLTLYAADSLDSAFITFTITVEECLNLAVTPDTLHFTAAEGGTDPDPDSFAVSEIGDSAIAFDLVETSGWFDLDKTSGTTPEDVEVSVYISGLTADTYFDSVTVSSGVADNSPVYQFISLIIVDTMAHTFTVDSIAAVPGGEVVVPVQFVNPYDLEYIWVGLDWGSDYLTLDSVSFVDSRLDFFPIKLDSIFNDLNLVKIKCHDGVVAPGTGNFVNLHFSVAAGTPTGFYDIVRWICTVPPCPIYNPYFIVRPGPDEILYLEPHFTPGGIEVVPPANYLTVDPDTLYFFADSGGALTDTSFIVRETGGAAIAYTVSEASIWFDLDRSGGTTPDTVGVSFDISSLTAGDYFDSVTVTSGEADNSPQYAFISLEVTEAPKFLEVTPDTLYFTAVEGGSNPDADTFTVSETGGGAIAFNLAETSGWFDLDKTSGTTPEDVEVSVDITGLTANTYFDSVTVSSGEADNSPVYQFISLILVDTMAHTFTVDSVAASSGEVVVPVEFVNLHDLEYISVRLDWDSDYLTLDSVSFADSRLDFFPIKWDSIRNDLNFVQLKCYDSVVAPGAGNFVNLHFSIDAGTPTGFYDIVRWICTVPPCPMFNPYFIVRPGPDEILYLEPHFTPGGIAVYDVCGYVVDPDDLSIPDATVELWDFFPDGLLVDTDTTDVNGLFGFSDVGLPQFDLWAYHEGYYPRLVEDVPSGETGLMIVLTPPSGTIAVTGVDLPGDTTGAPEDTVRFRVGVRNDGDSLDIYRVTSKSARDWQTINQDTFTYADVSETVYVYFDVIIPTWPGDPPDTITFSVFSYLDTSKHVDGNVELKASLTDVGDEPFAELPGGFYLHQNYPNPFNPTTTISFTLSSRSNVRLEIFDLLGRQVDIRDLGRLPSGDHSLEYDASGFPSGVYFYRLVTETSSWTRKMILLK